MIIINIYSNYYDVRKKEGTIIVVMSCCKEVNERTEHCEK
jgi:hypothetical protein